MSTETQHLLSYVIDGDTPRAETTTENSPNNTSNANNTNTFANTYNEPNPMQQFRLSSNPPLHDCDGSRPALLVLNMQNDFMENGALAVPGFDVAFIERVNSIRQCAKWSIVIFTQTKHPSNHLSFSSTHPGSKPFVQTTTKNGDDLLLLPDFCLMGTHGADFCERLEMGPHDIVVDTGLSHHPTDYPIFANKDTRDTEPIARKHLERVGATHLYVVGADIDGEAILDILVEAAESEIETNIVIDAVKTRFRSDELQDIVNEMHGTLIDTSDVADDVEQLLGSSNPAGKFRQDVFDTLLAYVSRTNGTPEEFMELVSHLQAEYELVNTHPVSGKRFVHYICQNASPTATRVLKHLLAKEICPINQECDDFGGTPAIYACRVGAFDNLNAILNCREQAAALELDINDGYGRTPMMYAVMRRDVELVALLLSHPMGGKGLLRAHDTCKRNILLLSCLHAGEDPSMHSGAASRTIHSRGEAVLDYLWDKFQSREFTDARCDDSGWNFWNYAVKHNLVKILRRGINMIKNRGQPTMHSQTSNPSITSGTSTASEHTTNSTSTMGSLFNKFVRGGQPSAVAPHKHNNHHPTQPKRTGSLTSAISSAGNEEGGAERGERRMSIHTVLQHRNSKLMVGRQKPLAEHASHANLPADLKVVFSRNKFSFKRKQDHSASRQALYSVLTRTINSGMNLLHQATWQRKQPVVDLLIGLYVQEQLLQVPNESGMSCLDLTAEDIDPAWPFMLIKHGCVPKQTVGLTMYHLCIKAILLGEPDVVRHMILSDDFGVNVDNHLMDICSRARFISACTATFSSPTATLAQLCFTCAECDQIRPGGAFCSLCAFLCHNGHKGVVCTGPASFHCVCSQLQNTCQCKKCDKAMELPLDVMRISATGKAELMAGASTKSVDYGVDTLPKHTSLKAGSGLLSPLGLGGVGSAANGPKSARMTRMKSMRRQTTNKSETEIAPVEKARAELVRLQGDMTYRDFVRHVFLMHAAKRGSQNIIEELVKFVRPDFPVDESLDRPLHLAGATGNTNTCTLLKHNGARVSVINSKGETPLHVAARCGHVEVCQLIAHNSNLLRLDCLALTPMHHAIRNDKPDVVDFLAQCMRHKARISLPLDDMFLQVATSATKSKIDKSACDASAVPREVVSLPPGECEGHASPLHLAVRYGKTQCASILMRHGASPLKADATGFSPYQTAIWELFATRKRLESYQEYLRRQVGNDASEKDKVVVSTGKHFFRYLQGTQGSHLEAQLEDLNKDLPADLQTLSPKVAHDLVDEMGKSPEVESTRKRFAYGYLVKWVMGYLIVLVLLLGFSLPRSNERYYMSRAVGDFLSRTEWMTIDTANEAWDWLSHHLCSSENLMPPVVSNSSTIGVHLLGAVRLRQIRTKPHFCDAGEYDGKTVSCTQTFSTAEMEDKNPMLWQPPIQYSNDSFNWLALQNARVWRSGNGVSKTMDFGRYSNNGYFVDLDLVSRSAEQNMELFEAMQTKFNGAAWFDTFTRYLSVEFVVYNLNFDTFGSVVLSLEAGAAGELKPTYEITVHTVVHEPWQLYPSIGFKVATLLVAIFLFSGCISNAICNGWSDTVRKTGTLFDVFLGGFALVLFLFDTVVTAKAKDMSLNLNSTESFQTVASVVSLIETQTYLISCLILLLWLRLIKYSVLLPQFGRVTYAFMNTMKNFDVLSYLLFVAFVIVGFDCAFTLAFGQIEKTSTYDGTLNLLMQMTMGGWSDDVFQELPAVMSSIMYISFMVVVAVIFINLFISVLSEVYPVEKKQAAVQCNDNLTMLIEAQFIMNTNSIVQSKHKHPIRQAFHAQIVVPVLRALSVLMRLFNRDWNFDIPQHEFGWEQGRDFFGVGVLSSVEANHTNDPRQRGE